jgi:hypothetical protein
MTTAQPIGPAQRQGARRDRGKGGREREEREGEYQLLGRYLWGLLGYGRETRLHALGRYRRRRVRILEAT